VNLLDPTLLVNALHVPGGGFQGQLLREQEIPGKAIGHLDDLSPPPDILDVRTEHDFHISGLLSPP
jgi:hypothetical protein